MASMLKIVRGTYGVNKLFVLLRAPCSHLVVYFVGDQIQEFGVDPAILRLQTPQEILNILSAKFGPQSTVAVIAPSRVEGCFVCYDHFFDKLTLTGEPLGYGRSWRASEQLYSLLRDAELITASSSTQLPIDVVGFSKGAVVVNQLLAELGAFAKLPSEARHPPSTALFPSLRTFHFLDAGLNSRGAYLTNADAWEGIGCWCRSHKDVGIVMHGTPRQWSDRTRPFLGEERDRMVALATQEAVPIKVIRYFEGEKPSLKQHFMVLEEMEVP